MDEHADSHEAVAVLCPRGSLDGGTAGRLKEDARRRIEADEDVVLDMSEVSFTDSEGLSALVAVYKAASARSRRLALARVRNNLRALLELTRLHRIFDVYPDVESARAALEVVRGG